MRTRTLLQISWFAPQNQYFNTIVLCIWVFFFAPNSAVFFDLKRITLPLYVQYALISIDYIQLCSSSIMLIRFRMRYYIVETAIAEQNKYVHDRTAHGAQYIRPPGHYLVSPTNVLSYYAVIPERYGSCTVVEFRNLFKSVYHIIIVLIICVYG